MSSTQQPQVRIAFTFQPRYRVFDLSGAWDFAVDYYAILGRAENESNKPRALKILVQESLLDLPYALKNEYLRIRDFDRDEEPLDFSDLELDSESSAHEYLILPERRSSGPWYKGSIKISASIDAFGQIAATLVPHHKYRLEATEKGLASPIKWCKFVDEDSHDPSSSPSPVCDEVQSDSINLSWTKKRTGKAEFKALPSLMQPPQIQVKLFAISPLEFTQNEDLNFGIEITNSSDKAVTVLSKGHQRFVSTLDVLYQEHHCEHNRITAGGEKIEPTSLSLCDVETNHELIEHKEPVCTLTLDYDKPPHRARFTTLEPGAPLIKQGLLRDLLPPNVNLEVGTEYKLSIPPLGAGWFWGTIQEVFGSEERQARIPWKPLETPPIFLASENEITFKVTG